MSVPESSDALLERVLARVAELEATLVERDRVIAEQGVRIAELERRLGKDSSNSSCPPSSDAPWEKKSAKKRSSRGRSGRKPGSSRVRLRRLGRWLMIRTRRW